MEEPMITLDFISEIVTLGLLHALKGVGNRAFYRWLTRDYRALFPQLPERTRLFRLFRTPQDWTQTFLAAPTVLGVIDPYGIELIHPMREGRSPQQIGRKGLSNHRWIVGGKLCLLLNQYGLVVAWACATANTADNTFQWLIRQWEERMIILSDTGFHALTITHIDFLSVWPRASPRPAMSSHAGHATRSARRAYRPSDDSGDRRDGLSTTPLDLASASTPLALCQTWPPRRRIRPHSATRWPARPAPAARGPATPQSVRPRWCTSPLPFPNCPSFPAARPRCDSRSSASGDTPRLASDRCISARSPAPPAASRLAPASTTTSVGPRMPAPASAPTPPPTSTSAAMRGGISRDPDATSWSTPPSPPSPSVLGCRLTALR